MAEPESTDNLRHCACTYNCTRVVQLPRISISPRILNTKMKWPHIWQWRESRCLMEVEHILYPRRSTQAKLLFFQTVPVCIPGWSPSHDSKCWEYKYAQPHPTPGPNTVYMLPSCLRDLHILSFSSLAWVLFSFSIYPRGKSKAQASKMLYSSHTGDRVIASVVRQTESPIT